MRSVRPHVQDSARLGNALQPRLQRIGGEEDAEVAANALEITLTRRDCGSAGRVAMAGVPYHSVEKYLACLLEKGFRVALCEDLPE